MIDFSRMFAGGTAGAGGGEWNTVVKPNVATGGMLPGGSYGTDGSLAGVNLGAFGKAAGGVMKDSGASMGGASQSGGSGAFAGPSIQPPPQDMGQAAQAALATQNAAAQQRMAQINQPSAAAQQLRGYYDGRV